MTISRRQILKSGFLLPVACFASYNFAEGNPELPVWEIKAGTLHAIRRISGDHCYIRRLPVPASGNVLEATLQIDEGNVLGLVLNADSAKGPRYVLGIGSAGVRVYEFMWPGKNWFQRNVLIAYGKPHSIRVALSQEGIKSTLKIILNGGAAFSTVLPAQLDSFYQPGVFAFDAIGSVTSLRVNRDKAEAQIVLPLQKPELPEPPAVTSMQEPGHEAFGKWLQAEVRDIRRRMEVPALGCVVVRGKLTIAAAVDGVRKAGSNTPVMLTDRFHLGSNTKSMTATLLAIYIEKKLLTWETPLEKLLPDLAGGMHAKFRGLPLSFLVHQSSGILDQSEAGLDYRSRGNCIADQRTIRAKAVLSVEPAFEAGSKHHYQNINFIVAGAVVDRLAGGEAWEQAIRKTLFAPLGITTAGYGPMGLPGTEMQPYGHVRENGVLKPIWNDNAPSLGPAGTLHMTLADHARYAMLHLSAEMGVPGLLSLESMKELHRPLHGYGKGWGVGGPDAKGRYQLSHSGSNTMNTENITLRPGVGAVIAATNESPFGEGHGGKAASAITDSVFAFLSKQKG